MRKTEAEVSCRVFTQYMGGESVGISTANAALVSFSLSSSLFTVILTNTEKRMGEK